MQQMTALYFMNGKPLVQIRQVEVMKYPRNTFVFYRSMWEAAECMPNQKAKLRYYEMVFAFGFDGKIPEKEKTVEYATFIASYKAIESACNRHDAAVENGKKGGRPPKQNQVFDDPPNELNTEQWRYGNQS
jgi:hypothetical protein